MQLTIKNLGIKIKTTRVTRMRNPIGYKVVINRSNGEIHTYFYQTLTALEAQHKAFAQYVNDINERSE